MSVKPGQSLGDVLRDARVAKEKGLRELARDMDITPSYLSDIENDRRVPAEDVLRKLAELLSLSFEDLMALAGRVGEDTERYLRKTPAAGTLFRQVSQNNLSEEEINKLRKIVSKMGNQKAGDT